MDALSLFLLCYGLWVINGNICELKEKKSGGVGYNPAPPDRIPSVPPPPAPPKKKYNNKGDRL